MDRGMKKLLLVEKTHCAILEIDDRRDDIKSLPPPAEKPRCRFSKTSVLMRLSWTRDCEHGVQNFVQEVHKKSKRRSFLLRRQNK